MGCASWRESSRRGPLDLCRTFSLPVQRTPQSVRRHSDVKPLLLGPLLPRETLIGRVFLGAADVEASAIVRVGERVGDVGVLASRDELGRWHALEVADPLGNVGGPHLESRRGQQFVGALCLVPANGRAPGQRQERGGSQPSLPYRPSCSGRFVQPLLSRLEDATVLVDCQLAHDGELEFEMRRCDRR